MVIFHIGSRGKAVAKKSTGKYRGSCVTVSSRWMTGDHAAASSRSGGTGPKRSPPNFIEGVNATISGKGEQADEEVAFFFKKGQMAQGSIGWFFWQYNLECQTHI